MGIEFTVAALAHIYDSFSATSTFWVGGGVAMPNRTLSDADFIAELLMKQAAVYKFIS